MNEALDEKHELYHKVAELEEERDYLLVLNKKQPIGGEEDLLGFTPLY